MKIMVINTTVVRFDYIANLKYLGCFLLFFLGLTGVFGQTLTISDPSANEDDGPVTVNVTLDQIVPGGFEVEIITTDGTATTANNDYNSIALNGPSSVTLNFVGNLNEVQSFQVEPISDVVIEPDETFTVSVGDISVVGIDTTDTGVITIQNDDSCQGGTSAPTINGDPTVFCDVISKDLDDYVTGTDPVGSILTWSTNNDPLVTGAHLGNSTVTATGTYYGFYWDATNSCASPTVDVTLTQNNTPSAGVASNTTACNAGGTPTSIDLDDRLDGSQDVGVWSVTTDPSGSMTIGVGNVQDFSGLAAGDYVFTYTTTGAVAPCTNATSQVTITVSDCSPPCNAGSSAPTINGDPTVFCDAFNKNLDDYVTSATPGGSFLAWSTNPDPLVTLDHTSNTVSLPGTYYGFYYDAVNTCASPTVTITLIQNNTPSAGVATNTTACNAGGTPTSIDLDNQLDGSQDAGVWSVTTDPSGTMTIGVGNLQDFSGLAAGDYVFTYTTSGALAPCTSATSQVTVTVSDCTPPCNAGNTAPVVNGDSTVFCDAINKNLDDYVTSPTPGGSSLTWSTNPDPLITLDHTANTVTLAGTYYGFYYDAVNTCASPTVTVILTQNTTPTVDTTTPGSVCGSGTVQLEATASSGTASLTWFDQAVGGSSVGTGSPFTTPSINTTTTYYVEASEGGCTSARTAVVATVNTVPTVNTTTPGSVCGSGTVQLEATASSGTASLTWFDQAVGGSSVGTGNTLTTPSLNATTTYYVEVSENGCTSGRTAVVATVYAIPTITGFTTNSICGSGSITISATTSSGGATIQWFDALTGGTQLGVGANYTTPVINTTTTYFVQATENGCTTSNRTAVNVIVNEVPTVDSTTPDSVCGSGVATLQATASFGATLNWYDQAVGGVSLGSGTSFDTPNLTTTTTFYVEALRNSCESVRIPVLATVVPLPEIDDTNASDQCGPGTVQLQATSSSGSGNFMWYAQAVGGTAIATGSTFDTPQLNATTTYWVEVEENGCVSSRVAVDAVITDPPNAGAANNTVACSIPANGTSVIDLDGQLTGADAGTWTVGSGPGAVTINAQNEVDFNGATSGDYIFRYTVSGSGPCPDDFVEVTVTVTDCIGPCDLLQPPTLDATEPTLFCDTFTKDLNDYITSTAPANTELVWSVNDDPLVTDAHLENTVVTIPRNYYAFYYNETEGCAGPVLELEIVQITSPEIVTTTGDTRCGTGDVVLTASSNRGSINWYSSETGGTSLFTGPEFTAFNITETTVFYVEANVDNCTSERVPVTATVLIAPTAGTPSNGQACSTAELGNNTVDLDDLLAGADTGTWAVTTDPSGSMVIGADNIQDFTDLPSGDYVFTFTTNTAVAPCTDSSESVTVTVTDCLVDSDSDGLFDHIEANLGTDPNNNDSDADGILDGIEVGDDTNNPLDSDEDGIIDALDSNIADSDNDDVVDQEDPANDNPCLPNPRHPNCPQEPIDLEVLKEVDEVRPLVGAEVVFTVTVTNLETETTVETITLRDPISTAQGFEFIEATESTGVYDPVSGDWLIDALAAGENATLTVRVRILESGTYINRVEWIDSFPLDETTANNVAEVILDVRRRTEAVCGALFNQFSPDGNGVNDFLVVNCIENFPNNSLTIFDRYGNEVFAAQGYDNSWDGTGDNGELPKGTYFYILDLGEPLNTDGPNGTTIVGGLSKGWIQIIR
ncbi:Ig-like domain-containing protein [Sediminicola luteus]|nr:gliding motility-associated C-terminal domain-containing protein [Sediminicola luteus]